MIIKIGKKTIDFESPNICPYCHVAINPSLRWHVETKNIDNNPIFLTTWLCTNNKCNKIFVANYKIVDEKYYFHRFLNGLPQTPEWPISIIDLKNGSPTNLEQPEQTRFIEIYSQSLFAENNGLDELAGMGYRKSIEFLVKDLAIKEKPKDKEKIISSNLGTVISNYFTGELKDILERATWLGNDQTHYYKVFEEYDIETLIALIDLIVSELDTLYKKKHYINTIQKVKNKLLCQVSNKIDNYIV